jgi:hypothetical protein
MYGDFLIQLACADFYQNEEGLRFDDFAKDKCEPFFESLSF